MDWGLIDVRCIRHYLPPHDAEVDGQLHQKLKRIEVYEVDNVDCVLWLERTTPRRSSARNASGLPVPTEEALAIVKTTGDVVFTARS